MCIGISCTTPASTNGYTLSENDLSGPGFDVTVSPNCTAGYVGTPAVAVCTSDGGAYTVSGCSLIQVDAGERASAFGAFALVLVHIAQAALFR